jgi:hypothetical protein
MEKGAEKWVFETNGHKWSNNDDTAGDNFSSFIAGAKWQQEQAKEMEKEQIEKAFEEGIEEMINRINSHTMCKHTDVSAEKYYNETFKQQ